MNNKSTTALINSNVKSTVINYDNNVDEGIKLIYGDYNNHDNNVNATINNNSLKTPSHWTSSNANNDYAFAMSKDTISQMILAKTELNLFNSYYGNDDN